MCVCCQVDCVRLGEPETRHADYAEQPAIGISDDRSVQVYGALDHADHNTEGSETTA
jgi:hypothetical protein